MCGRLKWRTNAWRYSAAGSSGIPRIILATCTYPTRWTALPAIGKWGAERVGIAEEGRRRHVNLFLSQIP